MDFQGVMSALQEAGTAQNIKVYRRHGAKRDLFGVSFANYKKIKKQLISEGGKKGFNQEVAEKLWQTNNTDAQILACMIAEPEKIKKTTIVGWSKSIDSTMLSNPFSDLIYKTPFKDELIKKWIDSKDEFLARVPFTITSLIAKNDDKPNDYFYPVIERIEGDLQSAKNWTKEGMNNCLITIGGRNEQLKDRVFEAADRIGLVKIDHGETSCKTFDIKEYVERIHKKRSITKA